MHYNKLFIFTEGGGTSGFGHIIRCSSIYDYFVSKGFRCEFIVKGDIPSSLTLNYNVTLCEWDDLDEISKFDLTNCHVIIDSYNANYIIYKYIANLSSTTPIYIDDFNRINYPKGVIYNPNIYSEEVEYNNDKCLIVQNKEYILLRNDFYNVVSKKTLKEKVNSVLVFLGGGAHQKYIENIVNYLKYSKNIKDIHCIVNEDVKDFDADVKFHRNLNAKELIEIMRFSDVAITSGGQILMELITQQVPTLALSVARNQDLNLNFMSNEGLIIKSLNSNKDFDQNFNRIMKQEVRKKLTSNMKLIKITPPFKIFTDSINSYK